MNAEQFTELFISKALVPDKKGTKTSYKAINEALTKLVKSVGIEEAESVLQVSLESLAEVDAAAYADMQSAFNLGCVHYYEG